MWSEKAVSMRGCGGWTLCLLFGLPSTHSDAYEWQIPVNLFFQRREDLTGTAALNHGQSARSAHRPAQDTRCCCW